MFGEEMMAIGISFNAHKRNGDRKNTGELFLLDRCKWESDVSRALPMHEVAEQNVVNRVL
jgi:hypothetical protein